MAVILAAKPGRIAPVDQKDKVPMPIALLPATADQSLAEGQVGKASATCVFPCIQQCIAVVGVRVTHLACTHITPGSSAQDIVDTFESLKEVGGAWASAWYLLCPLNDFFSAAHSPWTSQAEIKTAFEDAFGSGVADYWIMDVGTERNQFAFGLDIRADFTVGAQPAFSYKKAYARHITTWNAFGSDFVRL